LSSIEQYLQLSLDGLMCPMHTSSKTIVMNIIIS
jgi:hypothetical protein